MHPPDVDDTKLNTIEDEIEEQIAEQNIPNNSQALLNRMYDLDEKNDELIKEIFQKPEITKL
jgi:hypothetical protein